MFRYLSLVFFVTCSCTLQHYRRQLTEESLPHGLYEKRHQFVSLTLNWPVTDLSWLRDAKRLRALSVDSKNVLRVGPMPDTLTSLRLENTGLVAVQGLSSLKVLELKGNRRAVDLSGLNGASLEELVVDGVQGLDGGLPDMPNLKRLVIRNTPINFDLSLARFGNLKQVQIGFLTPPEFKIEGLDQVGPLECLALEGGWTPRVLPTLTALRLEKLDVGSLLLPASIASLDLRQCQGLSRLSWRRFTQLKTLRLQGYMGIDDIGDILDQLPDLERLHLNAVPFRYIDQLAGRSLSGLELCDLAEPTTFPDNPLAALATLPLKHLTISVPYLQDGHYAVLASLKALHDLTLRYSLISKLDMAWFPQMEHLVLEESPIQILSGMSDCKSLRKLTIRHCENLMFSPQDLPELAFFHWEGFACLGFGLCSGPGTMTWDSETCGRIIPARLLRLNISATPSLGYGTTPGFSASDGMADLTGLSTLELSRMRVASLSFLSGMTGLNEVRLEKLQLTSLEGLPEQIDSLMLGQGAAPVTADK